MTHHADSERLAMPRPTNGCNNSMQAVANAIRAYVLTISD
jgi:hypothetical protein